jgi:3-mercaptopyruvate sulfurtransferase SseA
MIRETIVILAFVAAATGFSVVWRGLPVLARPATEATSCSGPLPERPAVLWVSAESAVQMLGRPDVAFVDTRSQDEFESGHVAGALHAPMTDGTIPPRVRSSLAGITTVIAYCDGTGQCARSSRFAGLLSAEGWPDVRVLEGGIASWLADGRPAESGECRQCQ